jgi:transcriptional regulator with XRE-family HTH domain
MNKVRTYSRYSLNAAILIGKQIRFARKKRKWSEVDLAERAGVSRSTIKRIEKGDMTCALGLVFEVAVLVGIKLFESDDISLTAQIERLDDKIALFPKAVQNVEKKVDDAF